MVDKPLNILLSSDNRYDMIYSCGSQMMTRTVSEIAKKFEIPCQISLEQRMSCGIGACLVCTCKIQTKNETEFLHVCKDGPVFNAMR